MSYLIEPTPEQCNERAMLSLSDGRIGYACWYPQMGGYVGKCILIAGGGCVDAYVWHDGDFPFSGDDTYRESVSPRVLHHCDGGQFVAFGEFIEEISSD